MWLQLALLLPPVATAAALAGPSNSRRRQPPPRTSADASPAAAENAVLQVEVPTPLRITYATEASCVESWLRSRQHEPAFGFDTETRPSYSKGEVFAPATLQLSTATDCLVVHVAHLEAPLPTALVEVLASTDVLKCGLGIDDDAIELWLHRPAWSNAPSRQRPCWPPVARGALALCALRVAALWAPEPSLGRVAPAGPPWSLSEEPPKASGCLRCTGRPLASTGVPTLQAGTTGWKCSAVSSC